jgi:sporulation protein YlmC with PRC-barrel domain
MLKGILMAPQVLSASTLTGNTVCNTQREKLGKVEDIVLDTDSGRVAYGVLSFGGFLGMGDKLFAIPWKAMRLDTEKHEFVLDVEKDVLEQADGFDKDNWPNMTDRDWGTRVHDHYKTAPYWD